MKTKTAWIILVVLAFCLADCSGPIGTTQPEPTVENRRESDMERDTVADVSADASEQLVQGNERFAFDLYKSLQSTEGNLFFSPYSISLALAMTYAGAEGDTAQQMAEVMHFSLPQADLHPAFNMLDLELASRGEGAQGRDGEGFRLHVVNALWGQQGYSYLTGFLDSLSRNYGAGMNFVDYAGDSEAARQEINAWVEGQTEDRIQELIGKGLLDELTRLVLTNAVYFNAAWMSPFDSGNTVDGGFNLLDNTQVPVPMMQQVADFRYAAKDGWQAVELPYIGGELSMLILLPDGDQLEQFEASLYPDVFEDMISRLSIRNIALKIPVFETSSAFSLSQTLQQMGMTDAFTEDADFSGMDGTRELFISAVLHKAFISVDESGTEAAAATAVVMSLKAVMDPPLEVSVDRPFLFLIRDNPTGTILFMGRILDPTG
ncbi:MAG: serpin family protein [Anaerolineales bacterium]|nr:serpin family protein [Anaerolineales bacterium]